KSNQQAELATKIQQHNTDIMELLHVISQHTNDKDNTDSTITMLLQPLLAMGSDNDIAQTLADSKDKLNQYKKEIADTLERYESYSED
ncbi:hypothetical protein SB749_19745, partial [Brevibacterium sp. SIMBA_078]|uniref:hypothetical protein n=1 Tax=Brevibacterium sp. SIMBA_078 TaxID=3085816 RepID=UPI0039786F4A